MGRLTDKPELKTTPSGKNVCSFSLAVERNYATENGEREADFIRIVAWKNTADFICKYFSKGSMIAIVGAIRTRSYENSENVKVYVTEVVAETVSFTGEKKKEGTTTNTQPQATSAPAPDTVSLDDIPDDDDYPF